MIIRKELDASQCFDVINYLNKVHRVPEDPRLGEISRTQAVINNQKDIVSGMQPVAQNFESAMPLAGSMLCMNNIAGFGIGVVAALAVPSVYTYLTYRDMKKGIKDVKDLANDIAKTMYYNYEYQCKCDGKNPLTYEQVCDDAYAYEMMLEKYYNEQNRKKELDQEM